MSTCAIAPSTLSPRRSLRDSAHADGDVDARAERADDDHQPALDVGRVEQAPDRLDRQHAREHQQRGAVELRGEDLGAAEPERVALGRRPGGERGRGNSASPIAPASVSMCAASESSASDDAMMPTTTSTTMKPAISASAMLSHLRSASAEGPWLWPCA